MTRKVKNFDKIYDEEFFSRKKNRKTKRKEAEKQTAIKKRLERTGIKREMKKKEN